MIKHLVFWLLIGLINTYGSGISPNASNCLKRLKDSQPGALANWIFNSTTTTDICTFKEVSCSKTLGIFQLSLFNHTLQGAFPSMADCVGLTTLNLNFNNFTGTLVHNLCETLPSSLTTLSANNNSLMGTLPDFSNCRSLANLELSFNRFSGVLVHNLCETLPSTLTTLSLKNNMFSGALPSLTRCSNLSTLDLSYNNFSGSIPDDLCANNITSLTLSYNNLNGRFPAGLDYCHGSLNISNNKLTGDFPPNLKMANLEQLNVTSNDLSGVLYSYLQQFGSPSFENNPKLVFQAAPTCLRRIKHSVQDPKRHLSNWQHFNLKSMCKFKGVTCNQENYELNLAHLGLSGTFPSCLEDWVGLTTVDLSSNNFSGLLPSFEILIKQHILTSLNVSHNNLSGMIPSTYNNLSYLDTDYNKYLNNTDETHGHDLSHLRIVLYIVLPIVSLAWLILFSYACLIRRTAVQDVDESDEELSKSTAFKLLEHLHLKEVDFLELTNNFDPNLIIGRGGSSTVYMGRLQDGQVVAVKRLDLSDGVIARKAFLRELQTMGKLRHRNLVKVLGYYSNLDYTSIILEYMPYGTLEQLLHPRRVLYPLEWSYRYDIALEVAKGLNYLHHECDHPVVHCDLKPSNILLDEDFRARIADFGVARIVDQATPMHNTFTFTWSVGYAAPETAQGARPSTKADVYSFGIILMELLTGERPCNAKFENGSIRDYVLNAMQRKQGHLILDKEIQVEADHLQEMLEVLKLALSCTENSPGNRPEVKMVLACLVSVRDKNIKVRFDKPLQELAKKDWLLEDVTF